MEIKNTSSNPEFVAEESNIRNIDIEYCLNQYMDELKIMVCEYTDGLFGNEYKT